MLVNLKFDKFHTRKVNGKDAKYIIWKLINKTSVYPVVPIYKLLNKMLFHSNEDTEKRKLIIAIGQIKEIKTKKTSE